MRPIPLFPVAIRLVALLLLALCVAALRPASTRAATITVTTLVDEDNVDPSTGCSLREAIAAANSDTAVGGCPAGAGADTITFAANLVGGTITLTAMLPSITSAITVQGPGAASLTVSGGGTQRLLLVSSGAQLTLTGLTLANGQATGGSLVGGAIFNDGGLTITTSTFRANQANFGGAIHNTGGTLTITGSTFSGNQVAISGGAIDNRGGSLSITSSTFDANQAAFGGAIFNDSSLSITSSSFRNNQAAAGGAILSDPGSVTITGSTFSANSTFRGGRDHGGAIHNTGGTLTITSSTFNASQADLGGAIFNHAGGQLSLTNSTLSGNQASFGGGAIYTGGGGISSQGGATTTLTNSTVAANQGGAALVSDADAQVTVRLHNVVFANPAPSCAGNGQVVDLGGNIAADASCPFTQSSSRTNTNPLLGPIQDNGGPTETMALLSGSPAIDAGVNCPPPVTDQRGEPRTAPCDSGAYETESAPTGSLSPTSGPEAGGTLVTITGSGFVPGATSVTFGLTPALSVDCPSTSLCQAVSPPGTGTVSVLVTVVGGVSGPVVVGDFTYLSAPAPPPRPMTLAVEVRRQIPPIVSENQIEWTVAPVVGAAVEALVGSTLCGQGVTDSRGRVELTVPADPPVTGCGRNGAEVTFRVNGVAVRETVRFQSGGRAGVTLTLADPLMRPGFR